MKRLYPLNELLKHLTPLGRRNLLKGGFLGKWMMKLPFYKDPTP